MTRPAGVRPLIGHTKRLPVRSWSVPLRLTRCLCHRRRRNAGWRRRRSWSTPSSSCRSSGSRQAPEAAAGAGRTPSRTASPAACRGRLGSWAQTGKVCCLDLRSRPPWLRASAAHIAAAQMCRGAARRIIPPAPFFSGTHPALCSGSWCASPATG